MMTYQGGTSICVFSPQGRDPENTCKISNPKSVKKTYDKVVRSYIFTCGGGHQTQIKVPNTDSKGCKVYIFSLNPNHPPQTIYTIFDLSILLCL